jgi:c-di-GMP-binding flagellar brake protein YcgR
MVVRKYPRFPVSFSSTLVQRDAFRHKGSLRDLSLRGCRVQAVIQPFTGMQVELHLHIPGDPTPITITNATVRWSGSHGVGMEFLNVAPPQQERLTRVIQQLAKKA